MSADLSSSQPMPPPTVQVSPLLMAGPRNGAAVIVWRGEPVDDCDLALKAARARLFFLGLDRRALPTAADSALARAVLARGEVVGLAFTSVRDAKEFRRSMLRRARAERSRAESA
jgi:hypothetical protein